MADESVDIDLYAGVEDFSGVCIFIVGFIIDIILY